MAIDQLTASCLGSDAAFRPTTSGHHHHHHGHGHDHDAGRTPAEAHRLNQRSAPALQQLVDELARTDPTPERTYELRCVSTHGLARISHCVLLCTDRRVVYAEVEASAGVHLFAPFAHGVLDVQNKLLKVRPELDPGPPPTLVWPRLAGDDDVLDLGVRHVMPEPSPHLRQLLGRVGTDRWAIPLAAGQRPTAPPAWHADPTGRHQHRWWDGVRWSDAVADGGVQAVDPI